MPTTNTPTPSITMTSLTMTKRAIELSLAPGTHRAIGLMSGTSHDGISAAIVAIDEVKNPPAKLIAFHSYPYPAALRVRLLRASGGMGVGTDEISTLNFELGRAFGRAAIAISRRARI